MSFLRLVQRRRQRRKIISMGTRIRRIRTFLILGRALRPRRGGSSLTVAVVQVEEVVVDMAEVEAAEVVVVVVAAYRRNPKTTTPMLNVNES